MFAVAVHVNVRVLAARMNAGFVHKRGRLYVIGTSGASCRAGVRSVDDPPATGARAAGFRHAARRDSRAPALGEPRIRGTPRQGGRPYLQPRARPGAGHVPPGRRRRPSGRRRLSRARLVVVAEHHVPPRQHDGGRLSRSPQQAEREPAAQPAAGGRRRVPRRASTRRSRSRVSASRRNPKDADAHYQLGAAVGLARVLHRHRRGQRDRRVPCGARGVRRRRDRSLAARSRSARTPGSSSAPIGTSWRRLSLPLRMMAYMAGFGGGKDKGISQIEEAAAYGGDNQTEARFALHPALQPRKTVRRRAEGAGGAARTLPAQPAGVARVGIDLTARRARRRGRTLPDRGADPVRRRPAAADVRRGGVVAIQARHRAGRARDARTPRPISGNRCLSTDANGFTRAAISSSPSSP